MRLHNSRDLLYATLRSDYNIREMILKQLFIFCIFHIHVEAVINQSNSTASVINDPETTRNKSMKIDFDGSGTVSEECPEWALSFAELKGRLEEYITNISAVNFMPPLNIEQSFTSLIQVRENLNLVTVRAGITVDFDTPNTWRPEVFCNIRHFETLEFLPEGWSILFASNQLRRKNSLSPNYDTYVHHHGVVQLVVLPYTHITVLCSMDPTYWPYHAQICTWTTMVKFMPGIFATAQNISCNLMHFEQVNPLWQLRGCAGEVLALDTSENTVSVKWHYLLTPFPTLYVLTLVAPLMLLAFVGPVIFLLPPHMDSRTDIYIALLLANFLTLGTVKSNVPQSRKIPYFYFYTSASIGVNMFEIILSIAFIRFYTRTKILTANKIALSLFFAVQFLLMFIFGLSLILAPWPDCDGLGNSDKCVYQNIEFLANNMEY